MKQTQIRQLHPVYDLFTVIEPYNRFLDSLAAHPSMVIQGSMQGSMPPPPHPTFPDSLHFGYFVIIIIIIIIIIIFQLSLQIILYCVSNLFNLFLIKMEKSGIRYGKTGNKNVQLVLKHLAAKRVKKRCCAFYHPRSNMSCNKSGCCRLRKFIAESRE